MFLRQIKLLIKIFLLLFLVSNSSFSEVIKEIQVIGNERVSNETIKMFGSVSVNQNLEKTYEDDLITEKKDRIEKFGQYDHQRVYGLDYFDKLKSIGFEVEPIKYSKDFKKEEIKKYGLIENEIIPVCKKLIH